MGTFATCTRLIRDLAAECQFGLELPFRCRLKLDDEWVREINTNAEMMAVIIHTEYAFTPRPTSVMKS